MHLIIIGGKGMLGGGIREAATKRGWRTTVLDLPELDITRGEGIAEALPDADLAVNCAAFTHADIAERERELCRSINATGAGNVAAACARRGIALFHLSTDYIFDGRKGAPYMEDDPSAPLNFYGISKREGEERALAAGGTVTVVRTQSLFGIHGSNFVRAILGQLEKGKVPLKVVSDQISSPTYTRHLAEALLDLASARPTPAIVHAAASGCCSWWEFAKAIVERVRPGVEVLQRNTAEMNYPALRPSYSVLDTTLLSTLIGRKLPNWREGLDAYLAEEPLAAAVRNA